MKTRKLVSIITIFVMLTVLLYGCGGGSSKTTTDAPKATNAPDKAQVKDENGQEQEQEKIIVNGIDTSGYAAKWAEFDTSKAVNIVFYALGTQGPDFQKVIDKVNERMVKLINTTVEIVIIPLSDFSTKYPLILAGGEDCDLIFTAPWLFYSEQVSNGAFKELDMDFIAKWMPITKETQIPQSWEQAKFAGKLYSVPRNASDYEQAYGVTVRKDLREKYNIGEIKSLEDYEKYLDACAADTESTGIYPLYAFPTFPIDTFLFTQFNNWHTVDSDVLTWDADNGVFRPEDCFYRYDTPEFKEYCLRQANWAKKGYWPSNAITGTIHTTDLFKEGKSASDLNMYKAANGNIIEMAKKNIVCEYYNILPEGVYTRISPYHYDGVAITSFSKNPERAALALDVMKNDVEINNMLLRGIEGEHYILDKENNTYTPGPKSSEYGDWAWSLRSQTMPSEGGLDPSVVKVREEYDARNIPAEIFPVDGFSFDNSKVEDELTLVVNIVREYRYSFDLGVFGDDTAAKYDEFIGKIKQAGIDKIVAEAKAQLTEFLKNK